MWNHQKHIKSGVNIIIYTLVCSLITSSHPSLHWSLKKLLCFTELKKHFPAFVRARINKPILFFHVYFWSLCARFNFRSLPLYKYLNCASIDHPPLASFSMTAALWRHKELESALESQPSSVEEQRDALMGPRFPWLRLPRAPARGQQPEKKEIEPRKVQWFFSMFDRSGVWTTALPWASRCEA